MMPLTREPVWWTGAAAPLAPRAADVLDRQVWDLVIVGGGIVGVCAAISAAQSGRTVCLIEANEVGCGTSSCSTVKVTSGHGALAAQIARRHGFDAAVEYQRLNSDGFDSLARLVADLPEDVGWSPTPHLVHAADGATVKELQESVAVSRAAGVSVTSASPPPWGEGGEAWAWAPAALVQPLSLVRALARRAVELGVQIVEHCSADSVREIDGTMVVTSQTGGLKANRVLIASQAPVHDPDAHAFRAGYLRHWAVVLAGETGGPDATYDAGPDGLSTRTVALEDGSPARVVVGLTARVGEHNGGSPYDHLLSLARERGLDGVPVFSWSAHDVRSPDLLPYVGPTRRDPRVIMATGLNGWGFTNAAGLALRLPGLLDAPIHSHEDASPWQARRIVPRGGAADTLSIAAWVASSEVHDSVESVLPHELPEAGEGVVLGGPLHPRAVCRTADGVLHSVSARCTHFGCLVRWNRWDGHWECPCHGSRFSADGEVLQGPAKHPLPVMDTEGPEDGQFP